MGLPYYTPEQVQTIAEQVNVDPAIVGAILAGSMLAPPQIARAINTADPRARLQDLRPDDWAALWPVLRLYGEA